MGVSDGIAAAKNLPNAKEIGSVIQAKCDAGWEGSEFFDLEISVGIAV